MNVSCEWRRGEKVSKLLTLTNDIVLFVDSVGCKITTQFQTHCTTVHTTQAYSRWWGLHVSSSIPYHNNTEMGKENHNHEYENSIKEVGDLKLFYTYILCFRFSWATTLVFPPDWLVGSLSSKPTYSPVRSKVEDCSKVKNRRQRSHRVTTGSIYIHELGRICRFQCMTAK